MIQLLIARHLQTFKAPGGVTLPAWAEELGPAHLDSLSIKNLHHHQRVQGSRMNEKSIGSGQPLKKNKKARVESERDVNAENGTLVGAAELDDAAFNVSLLSTKKSVSDWLALMEAKETRHRIRRNPGFVLCSTREELTGNFGTEFPITRVDDFMELLYSVLSPQFMWNYFLTVCFQFKSLEVSEAAVQNRRSSAEEACKSDRVPRNTA